MYYVYAVFDPRNCLPFYVGKGKGRRCFSHLRRSHNKTVRSRVCTIRDVGLEPVINILAQGLDEELAFLVEQEAISKWGRVDNETGILFNHTDGGEGPSGLIHTDEARAKIKYAANNPSEATRFKLGTAWRGKKRPTRSQQWCQKISAGCKGIPKPKTDAHKKALSESIKIAMARPEVREKLRGPKSEQAKANLRKPKSESAKANMKLAQQLRRQKERAKCILT